MGIKVNIPSFLSGVCQQPYPDPAAPRSLRYMEGFERRRARTIQDMECEKSL